VEVKWLSTKIWWDQSDRVKTGNILLQECSSLGIEGRNVVGELQELTKSLPQLLYAAAHTTQTSEVKAAVQYYQVHVAQIARELGSPTTGQEALLPTLAEVEGAHLEVPVQEQAVRQPGGFSLALNPYIYCSNSAGLALHSLVGYACQASSSSSCVFLLQLRPYLPQTVVLYWASEKRRRREEAEAEILLKARAKELPRKTFLVVDLAVLLYQLRLSRKQFRQGINTFRQPLPSKSA